MATSVKLLRKYVWLVDTIRRSGRISLTDINTRWLDNYAINSDHEEEIPERTFHRHREAIDDLFGVKIACDRSTNTYYIKDEAELSRPPFAAWLFNGLSMDNLLMTHESVKNRILFEDSPGGNEYLSVIVDALSANHVLAMTYRSYNRPDATEWLIEPQALKQYRRRWYLIGNKHGEDCTLTFALDRIVSLEITDKTFERTNGNDLNELFSEVVGVFIDDELDVEDVTIRVFGKQRKYFEGAPLHHSQKLVKVTPNYSDYTFRLRPEYEFQHEILRLGPDAEVLSPQWLRDDMVWYANKIIERYKS